VLTVVVLSMFYVVLPRALYGFMAFYDFVNFVWMDLRGKEMYREEYNFI